MPIMCFLHLKKKKNGFFSSTVHMVNMCPTCISTVHQRALKAKQDTEGKAGHFSASLLKMLLYLSP